MKFVLIIYFMEAICQTIINSLYNQYENIETFYLCLYLEWPHFGLNCHLELLATLLRHCRSTPRWLPKAKRPVLRVQFWQALSTLESVGWRGTFLKALPPFPESGAPHLKSSLFRDAFPDPEMTLHPYTPKHSLPPHSLLLFFTAHITN